MSSSPEAISCRLCGQSFETDTEKKHHVNEHHQKKKDWKKRSQEWAEKML